MNIITNDLIKCKDALRFLERVFDPEIGLNVVDLGLIYEISFNEEENKATCSMTLTTQFCPMGESIVENVRIALQSAYSNSHIEVKLCFQPPWNYDRISESGRIFLNR